MGNREDLLAGAKQCLREKGYTRTTARDIATASGVSLAAIGYHFGSKDALMNQALFEAIGEWGDELQAVLSAELPPDATTLQRFEVTWQRMIELFERHRPLMAASFEVFTLIEHVPEFREFYGHATQEARKGTAALFLHVDEDTIDARTARTAGSIYYALLVGVMSQWLVDPANAPTAAELTEGLRFLMADKTPAGSST
jgi:AcrR family transcriptional regulator